MSTSSSKNSSQMNSSRSSSVSLCYSGNDPKMSVKKFEAHKAFYEPMTNTKMYKQMRRAVRPTMPLFLFARHSDAKFYEDYWYLYPSKPQACDYNSLLRKIKRDSEMSKRESKMSKILSEISKDEDSEAGNRNLRTSKDLSGLDLRDSKLSKNERTSMLSKRKSHLSRASSTATGKRSVLVDEYIDNYTIYHLTTNDKSTKFYS